MAYSGRPSPPGSGPCARPPAASPAPPGAPRRSRRRRVAATRAADLPSAIMIRPQLGSRPVDRGLDQRGVGHDCGRRSAPPGGCGAPRTSTSTSLLAPSPSSTSMRASRSAIASSARANWRRPSPPVSSGAFSASPLARIATVSLVDVSLSTVTRLNESVDRPADEPVQRVASRPRVGRHEAEHRRHVRLDHPRRPWRCRRCVTGRPPTSTRSAASLGRVSVVMIASAAAGPPCGRERLDQLGQRRPGSCPSAAAAPMTPVEAISTWRGRDAEQLRRRSWPSRARP